MIRDWILPGLLDTGPVDDRIMAIRDGLVNFFIVKGPEGLVCIDAGWRVHSVRLGFETLGLDMRDVAAVFLTHRHWDHARCSDLYPTAQVFVAQPPPAVIEASKHFKSQPRAAVPQLNIKVIQSTPARHQVRVHDGQIVTAAGLTIRAIETPGHTSDSVCYLVDGRCLFTGDALRLRRGRVVPFPAKFNHNRETAKCSIRKLAQLKGVECLLTAHTGTTTDLEIAFMDWREADPDCVLCDGERP